MLLAHHQEAIDNNFLSVLPESKIFEIGFGFFSLNKLHGRYTVHILVCYFTLILTTDLSSFPFL